MPTANAEVSSDWRNRCVSHLTWRPCADQTGVKTGEAGGYWVEADGFDRRGYLKPANANPDDPTGHFRAAREKIAADLAHDLNLPVPPVVLTRRENPPDGCSPWVAVSLIMYPLQWPWGQVKSYAIDATPHGAAMAGALARCSPLSAFDTWLGQTDHGDHADNIVWGYNPANLADSRIIFLDYANSMGFNGQWNGDGWRAVVMAPWPPLMLKYFDRTALGPVLAGIEAFPEQKVREIVNRIPDDYLPGDQKTVVTDALIGRRQMVRNALQSALGAQL